MKTPTAILFTDLHLKDDNIEENIIFYNYIKSLYEDMDLRPKIINLGDSIDNKNKQSQLIINKIKQLNDIIYHPTYRYFESVILTGNHDKTIYDNDESFLSPLKINRVIEKYDYILTQNVKYHFLSYFSSSKYIEELNKIEIEQNKKNILFTHTDLHGAKANNNHEMESDIKINLFDKFDLVFSGHYHDPSSYNNKFHYIGAGFQHNFGENIKKGVTILYDDFSTELLPPPSSIKIYITQKINIKNVNDSKTINLLKEIGQNSHLRVIIEGESNELKSTNIQNIKEISTNTQFEYTDKIINDNGGKIIESFTEEDILTEFKKFCKEKDLDVDEGMKIFNYHEKQIN